MDLPPLTLEAILWLGVPPIASAAAVLTGLYSRSRRLGIVFLFVGILGLILSLLWFLLVLRVEAVVK